MMLSFIPQARATENSPAPETPAVITGDFSKLKQTSSGRIEKIIDPYMILLRDGKIIRLLGIDYPKDSGEQMSPALIAAKSRLEQLLRPDTEVELWQSFNAKSGRINRMGHLLAHVAIKKDGSWINGTLISEGLAWTVTDASNPEMADQLYKLEDKARGEKKGLWSDKLPYRILSANEAGTGNGSFRIVEGIITRAATSKNNLYLNFGNDMKKDFTVMIPAELRKAFTRRGLDPMSLQGQTVRVRGWIREWNGPFMELETPERLEIVAASRPSPDASTIPSTEPVEISPLEPQTGQVNP